MLTSGTEKYEVMYTINITSMVVLASIYLSVSTSLPSTPTIKPVEIWLLFNLFYPFLVMIINILIEQVTKTNMLKEFKRATNSNQLIYRLQLTN